jgi:excisionase family DNA binding protein
MASEEMTIAATETEKLDRRLFSIREAQFALGVGRTLIYELISLGQLETVRIGRRRLVSAQAIESLLAKLAEQQKSRGVGNG